MLLSFKGLSNIHCTLKTFSFKVYLALMLERLPTFDVVISSNLNHFDLYHTITFHIFSQHVMLHWYWTCLGCLKVEPTLFQFVHTLVDFQAVIFKTVIIYLYLYMNIWIYIHLLLLLLLLNFQNKSADYTHWSDTATYEWLYKFPSTFYSPSFINGNFHQVSMIFGITSAWCPWYKFEHLGNLVK